VVRLLSSLLVVLATSGISFAAQPGTKDWVWVKDRQGNVRDQISVTCSTDTELLDGDDYANVLSITCQNMDEVSGGHSVGICPRTAAPGACDGVAKYSFRLAPDKGFTVDVSALGDWSCNGISGDAIVNCHIERFYSVGRPSNDPSPTPIPTPTATPAPTPTP